MNTHDQNLARGETKIVKTTKEWHEIDWKQCYEKVFSIQEEIVIAYRNKDLQKVYIKHESLNIHLYATFLILYRERFY